ncbi:acetate kinase [bacterium]|jgi:acetate kinase|nr:acetate kinase [bacterium]
MNILVINAGSSSLKFSIFEMVEHKVLAEGIIERIGQEGSTCKYKKYGQEEIKESVKGSDYKNALAETVKFLLHKKHGVIKSKNEIQAIGHRVVHGGEFISKPVLIDQEIKRIIKNCFELAPLHNPPNFMGIVACEEMFPGIKQVGVFDTAFHQSIPKHAFLYGLPIELYENEGIRRYGFHGTSHRFIAGKCAELLPESKNGVNIISVHLGNGCSVTAVKDGKSIDTSMGFTPLEGLVMGTRCGDIDPAIVFHLMEHKGYSRDEIDRLLNKKSGLLGLAEIGTSDMRDILKAVKDGNKKAEAALDVFCYRIKKYIGAYTAVIGKVEALVFTAGIGENVPVVREKVCSGLEPLGYELDVSKNEKNEMVVSADKSNSRIMVIPTHEDLKIAQDTLHVLQESGFISR